MTVLCTTALSIGVVHTLLGPDHYVPFLAMARAGKWSTRKTVTITVVCGVGHILGSVVLGVVGIALGLGVFRLESVEAFRNDIAAWMLIAFGFVYFVYGLRRARRARSHSHWHVHAGGMIHNHAHSHENEHLHVHTSPDRANAMTPWILFTLFLFGPCELLIPLLIYPASNRHWADVVIVTSVFAAATLITMVSVVMTAHLALKLTGKTKWAGWTAVGRYTHALAGLAVFACGTAIRWGL